MKCLIIGYGSIGQRHARIARQVGSDVFVVSQQAVQDYVVFTTIEQALATHTFDYIVIANKTSLHFASLLSLIQLDYDGVVLVEKPLFAHPQQLPPNRIKHLLVGYQMRFHPLMLAVQKLLASERLISVNAVCGQYLPNWRPGSDYRQSYSAHQNEGGGVLRDLSHELDYLLLLCGNCHSLSASGGHYSHLELDSDDVYSLIMDCERCPLVTLHINYLNRVPVRRLTINSEKQSVIADFIAATLTTENGVQQFAVARDVPYLAEHEAIVAGDMSRFCQLQQALQVVELIQCAEKANKKREWVVL